MKSIFKLLLILLVCSVYSCTEEREIIYFADGANLATAKTGDVKTNLGALLIIDNNEVSDLGGSPLMQKGICYGKTEDPKITLENTSGYSVSSGPKAVGTFSDTVKGLAPNTKYYYRTYAYNGKGMAYGEVKSVTTNPVPTVNGNLQSTMYPGSWDVVVGAIPFVGYFQVLDMYEEGYNVIIMVSNNVATVNKQPIGIHPTHGEVSAAGSGTVVNGKVFNLTLTFTVAAGSFGAKKETLTLE